MYLNTNLSSLLVSRNLRKNHAAFQKSFSRLSSGLRIVSAADDAAGLAISEGMRSQIRSFSVAERNAGDGFSMAQTAEGALGEVHSVLGRMRELSMQASNGTLTSSDRAQIGAEFSELQSEVTRLQGSAQFNGISVIGASTSMVGIQVGLDASASSQIQIQLGGVQLTSVVSASTSVLSQTGALGSLARIDSAIDAVSTRRAGFGASMNRLDIASNNISTMRLNLSAAESRIRDADIAQEASLMARNQTLSQMGISVLLQANQLPNLLFSLIGR